MGKRAVNREKVKEIISRFCFHKPEPEFKEAMTAIRHKVRDLALEIEAYCPESKEKATALTQLAFVMMSANSAIVQQTPVDKKDLRPEELEFFKDSDVVEAKE